MTRLPACTAVMLAMLASPARSQPVAPDPAIPPAITPTTSMPDNRASIPIRIGGKGPWNFIIDTGSQRTVIANDLARQLSLAPRRTVTILSMTGRSETGTVAVPRLDFAGGAVDAFEAPVLEAANLGAAGLLGLDSLHAKRVTLDFRRNRMEVSDSRSTRSKPVDPDTIVVEAKRRKGQLILLDSEVNDMRVAVMLDTGSNFSIGNPALRDKLIARKRAPELLTATLTSVTGGELIGQVARIKSVRMGRVTLTQVPVLFADASPFAELGLSDKPALLLGISALRLFNRVAIDFGRGRVDFLLPDSSAIDGTRYAGAPSPAG